MKSFCTGLLVVLVVFVVTACGGGPEARPPGSTDQPAITGEPAGFNADDIAFATDLATSYGQTPKLTAMVPERSTNPGLVALADDIDASQAADLQTVKVFLVQWDSDSNVGAGSEPSAGVKGLVDDATIARLNSLSGKAFDAPWLRSMIGHAQGAIEMASAEVTSGSNVDAVATAKRIVTTQRAEVKRMQQLLTAG